MNKMSYILAKGKNFKLNLLDVEMTFKKCD